MSTLITTTAQIGTIKDAGGNNTAMTIDGTGRISTPARPAFNVYLSSATAAGDYTTLQNSPFDTIEFNIGNCVAISNNVATFTAPISGIYHINFTLSISGAEGSGHINSYLYVDGVSGYASTDHAYRHIEDPQGGTYTMAHSNALMQLNANQTVNPMISINADTSIIVRRACRFWGYLVG